MTLNWPQISDPIILIQTTLKPHVVCSIHQTFFPLVDVPASNLITKICGHCDNVGAVRKSQLVISSTVCAVQTLSSRFVILFVQYLPFMNGVAIMFSRFLFVLFCFVVGKFVSCSSVKISSRQILVHYELRRRENVGSFHDRALYFFLYFGILVLEQTNTIAIDVSSSHIFVEMFTLDLVRAQEARRPPYCLDLWIRQRRSSWQSDHEILGHVALIVSLKLLRHVFVVSLDKKNNHPLRN